MSISVNGNRGVPRIMENVFCSDVCSLGNNVSMNGARIIFYPTMKQTQNGTRFVFLVFDTSGLLFAEMEGWDVVPRSGCFGACKYITS